MKRSPRKRKSSFLLDWAISICSRHHWFTWKAEKPKKTPLFCSFWGAFCLFFQVLFARFAALPWAGQLELQQPRTRLTPESKRPAKRPRVSSHRESQSSDSQVTESHRHWVFLTVIQIDKQTWSKIYENLENLWVICYICFTYFNFLETHAHHAPHWFRGLQANLAKFVASVPITPPRLRASLRGQALRVKK